jgi:hypothetical protein
MPDLRATEANLADGQAGSILRWGGRAGILGSILMLLTFGFVAAFVGSTRCSTRCCSPDS